MTNSQNITPGALPTVYQIPHTEGVSSTTSERADAVLEIDAFLSSIEPIRHLDDFVRFREGMNIFFREVFAQDIAGKSETFILAFDQSNVSKYQEISPSDGEETRRGLRHILQKKNALYNQILIKALGMGLMDTLVTKETKEDIIHIVSSNILAFFDEVFIQWFDCMKEGNPLSPSDFPVYGGMKRGQRVGYKEFSSMSIDESQFQYIHNVALREYLEKVAKLIRDGNYNYTDWVSAEIHESRIWKNQQSEMGFVAPMEDYVFPKLFIEPEIIIFLKDSRNPVQYSDFYGLSKEFFEHTYGMDHMTCTHVETILEGGDATYSGFIGKAFPNDTTLSEQEGNNIILRTTPMRMVVANSKTSMHRLFPDMQINFDDLFLELLREVTYHEFGHSLFIKGHPTSLLEETKATLFYYLGIHHAHQKEPYTEEQQQRIILFTVMDSLRSIERRSQNEFKKYLILTKVILTHAFETGVLKVGESGLIIAGGTQGFELFLSRLVDVLFYIQDLYTLDTSLLEEKETHFLNSIEQNALKYIEYIVKYMETSEK